MNSLILRTATKFLLALMLLFSIFILFRGHDEPGGGFIGGLITGSAFALYVMAHGPIATRKLIRIDLRYLFSIGLFVSVASGLVGLLSGKPFLTGTWLKLTIDKNIFKLGTPVFFDIGVYIVIVAAILMIIFALEEK
jgi:multicomponent Na+:H+ antiporter subunit B